MTPPTSLLQAELMPRAFEKCTALRQLDLEQSEHNPNSLTRCLPECCFLEADLTCYSMRLRCFLTPPCKPLRLAPMNQQDWLTAIEQLVPQTHLPDAELLHLLRRCVPEQGISSMAEAQALSCAIFESVAASRMYVRNGSLR